MQLAVKTVHLVEEIEPAIFKIVVSLEGGIIATLRLDGTTMKSLMAEIVVHTIA
jgi:hypothetical protein